MTLDEADDREGIALYLCCAALAPLDVDGRNRVLEYLRTRYGTEGRLLALLERADQQITRALEHSTIPLEVVRAVLLAPSAVVRQDILERWANSVAPGITGEVLNQ